MKLHSTYCNLFNAWIVDEDDDLDPALFALSSDRKYAVKYDSTLAVFEDLGLYVLQVLEDLDVAVLQGLC